MALFGFDDDYTSPDNAPGASDWFKLDDTVGLGRTNRRHDLLKVENLLANTGDLDLSKIGGAMGYGLYTVDEAVRKYQGRNGLKVDGWLRPEGPTISKMKDQLGGLLSGYAAPTPEQTDLHFKLRNKGEDGLLAVEPPAYKLLPNRSLPPVPKATRGSNESWVNWMARSRTDLSGAPEMLATYIKNFGDDGIVQARDFVEQWDQAKPGEGSDAIRQILALVADPAQRERFLGGRLPQRPPFGVLKPDAEQRIAAMAGGAASKIVAEKTDDDPELVYDPISNTYVWKQPATPNPYGMMHAVGDDSARKPALPSENTNTAHHGLLEAAVLAERQVAEQGIEVAQNGHVLKDADKEETSHGDDPVKVAQATQNRRPIRPPNAAVQEPPVATLKGPPTAPRYAFPSADIRSDYGEKIVALESQNRPKPLEELGSMTGRDKQKQEVLGAYQLSRDALVNAGFKNPDGTWKEGNSLGVKTDDQFRLDPNAREIQLKAFNAVMKQEERQAARLGLTDNIGKEIDGVVEKFKITEGGLMAGIHRGGVGNVQAYFKRLEEHGWDSKKALDGVPPDTKALYRAIEYRTRMMKDVPYR